QRTLGWQDRTAARGKNRNSLNIRRADRPYPCGFCGGSLCANSGHSLSTLQRAFHPRYGRCVLYRVTQSTPFHRVFDFHGGPPLLELGTLDEMQRPRPSIFTVQRIRSAGLLGLSGGRAQSGVGIEVSMTLPESSHGTKKEKNGLFIDGANLYATAKSLGFDIDYKRLLSEFHSRGYLLRAFYYTAVTEDQEYSSIRPLID